MKTLKDLFLDQLADVYYAEKELTKALPKVAKAAVSDELRETIEAHLEETEDHVRLVESVFKCFDKTPRAKKCHGIMGILKEGEEMMEKYEGDAALDAAIISAAQKVEHYEISSYGCLVEWADQLDAKEAKSYLIEILEQEKEADRKLTDLAEERVNSSAEDGGEEVGKRSAQTRTASR
jgi:ferritin-like metal-binding protein YciE